MAEEGVRRLGRGLAALIGDVGEDAGAVDRARGQRRVPVDFLKPSANNPRRHFADEDLEDLASSVREKGIIQPILVRSLVGQIDAYEIIAGERRWRAAKRAGLKDVPIVVLEVSDREALELAIIENVQRSDLNAIEEAQGYESLIAAYSYTQADLAKIIGKSRSHIANTMRLLKLPDEVRQHVSEGTLSAGHARALLTLDDPAAVARRVIDRGLSVRDTELLAQDRPQQDGASPRRKPSRSRDEDIVALETALGDTLGMGVRVDHRGPGGQLMIRYETLEALERLCHQLRDRRIS
jgi:ParB family transcriptional regulator, chromosome partitioning protein